MLFIVFHCLISLFGYREVAFCFNFLKLSVIFLCLAGLFGNREDSLLPSLLRNRKGMFFMSLLFIIFR